MRLHWIFLLLPALGCVSTAADEADDAAQEGDLVHATLDTTHPNVVEMLSELTPTKEYVCTGTLIAPHTVLTAAHCVRTSPGDVHVQIGAQRVGVTAMVAHPSYDGTVTYDVAVLTLAEDAPGIEPAWLLPVAPSRGEPFTLVGYGRNDDGTLDDQRRSGTTTIHDVLPTDIETRGTSSTRPAIDSGDSGGPGFVVRDGRERLAGIASHSTGDCHFLFIDCTSAQHVRVDLFVDWIAAQLDEPLYDGTR